jgi:hypothetical protein
MPVNEESTKTKAKGRPKGSANRDVDQVDAPATACPKCGSTRREAYFNRRDLAVQGVCFLTQKPYTSIIIRRTSCSDCGQHRDDRQLVNEPIGRAA